MWPLLAVFILGAIFADVSWRITRHVQPRRGVPSPATADRLRREREQALELRVREWTHWGLYVAGLARSSELVLPPMPGSVGPTTEPPVTG